MQARTQMSTGASLRCPAARWSNRQSAQGNDRFTIRVFQDLGSMRRKGGYRTVGTWTTEPPKTPLMASRIG